MKIYTYSKARENLARVLEESKNEEVLIRRRKGDLFSVLPKSNAQRSPFDVVGLQKRISRQEIVDAVRASRARSAKSSRRFG